MYKGVVYGSIYHFHDWGQYKGNGIIDFRYGAKSLDEVLPTTANANVVRNQTPIGDIYTWEEQKLDPTNRYGHGVNAVTGWERAMAFENQEFQAKLQIGEPYKTASSCACTVYNTSLFNFSACMFLHNLWPLLHTITFDASDPTNVKKYIEGEFTFEKKGSVVALVGVAE